MSIRPRFFVWYGAIDATHKPGQSRSTIAFMYNFGKMPLLADQPFDGLIEHHRKPLAVAAHHHPPDLKLVVEFENRKLELDGLPLGNSPPGVDKNTCCPNILDDFPEHPLLDGVFRNNEGRPTGKSA